MSALIPIRSLKKEQFMAMQTDLHVVSIPPEPKNKFNKFQLKSQLMFYKKIEIDCYLPDQSEPDNPKIIVPFGYAYQKNLPVIRSVFMSLSNQKCQFNATLLERQEEIKDECLEIIKRTGSVLLSLYTGFGKTIFALYLASQLKRKTMIMVHRSIIETQWIDDISKLLPNMKYKVLQTKDTMSDIADVDILIANVVNVPKFDSSMFMMFGLLIIDEIHTVVTDSFSKAFLKVMPEYVIGLSATPNRPDGLDRLIELTVGPECIIRKMYRLFNVYKINTKVAPIVQKTDQGNLIWNSVIDSLSKNKERNELIIKLIQFFEQRNILVLCKLKSHVQELERLCKESESTMKVDTFFGSDKNVNQDCRVLISTCSKSGVGFSMAKLDMLIVAADVKDGFQQYLGRIFRKQDTFPIVVDLVDNHSSCKSHFTERQKIYTDQGGVVHSFDKVFKHFDDYMDMF